MINMERKIGEIFKFDGEWYQTLKLQGKCCSCDFMIDGHCIVDFSSNGSCFYCHRKDKENVIFKKLEKVGEPFIYNYKNERLVKMQEYKLFDLNFCKETDALMIVNDYNLKRISIEIKQNKEDMEEKKLNLKPFDIQKAREGKPVCTRDGRKARIVCFDREFLYNGQNYCIVALISEAPHNEVVYSYTKDGLYNPGKIHERDLMMLPEKRSGWINIYALNTFYSSKEEAEANIDRDYEGEYIGTTEIEWEE